MRGRLLATLTLAAALLAPAAARADIVVATEVPDPAAGASDTDIALVDATTGGRFGLPAGTNTAQDELHPSITPDGKRLVFERSGAGTIHVIVEELSSGQQA